MVDGIVGKSQFFLAEISATAVVPINEISGRMIGNTAGKLDLLAV